MNGQLLGAAAAVLVGLLTLAGAIYTTRSGGRASPYDKVVARVVELETQRETDRARIEALQDNARVEREEIGKLQEARREDRAKIALLEAKIAAGEEREADSLTKISGLERRMAGVIKDRDDILRWVDVLRVWFASGAKPPPPPIPEHLADVLPAWMPADGAEPPPRASQPHTD